MAKQINPEYIRKTTIAVGLADAAWLRGGLESMDSELKQLRRLDADQVIVAEFERLCHNQILRTLPAQTLTNGAES